MSRARHLITAFGPRVGIVLIALIISVLAMTLTDPVASLRMGDFNHDAKPALTHVADGGVFTMYGIEQPPLMMPLGIILQAPGFIAAGPVTGALPWLVDQGLRGLNGDVYPLETQQMMVAALLSGAIIAMILAAFAAWRAFRSGHLRIERTWQRVVLLVTTLGVLALNPLTGSAWTWAHGEEFAGTALLAGGLLLLAAGRWRWAAILVALAAATKQPFLLCVPVVFFMIPRPERLKALIWGAGAFLVASVPFIIGSPGGFFGITKSASQAPAFTHTGGNIYDVVLGDGLPWLKLHSHWLIVAMVIGISALMIWRHRGRIPLASGAAAITAIFLVRGLFDAVNIAYYLLPVVAGLILFELLITPVRLRFVPIGTFIAAFALASVDGGGLYGIIDRIGAFHDITYVIIASILTAVMLFFALRRDALAPVRLPGVRAVEDSKGDPRARRQRIIVWSIVGALLVLAVVVTAREWDNNIQLAPTVPPGMVEATRAQVAAVAGPAWALTPAPARLTHVTYAVNTAADGETRAAISYVEPVSLATVSIFLMGESLYESARTRVADCRAGLCAKGTNLITTPAGDGIGRGSDQNWSVAIPQPATRTVIVMSGLGAGAPLPYVEALAPVSAPRDAVTSTLSPSR